MSGFLIPVLPSFEFVQKRDLGHFEITDYSHKEAFAGRIHCKATDMLQVKQGDALYTVKLPTKLEPRFRKHGEAFHNGDSLAITGSQKGVQISTSYADILRTCPHR